jgi:formylglycine-generating enzyme required for sulfatase activity
MPVLARELLAAPDDDLTGLNTIDRPKPQTQVARPGGADFIDRGETESGEPRPGDLTTIALGDGLDMRFAWIPPGAFWMGSPAVEVERFDNETPHRVTLTKGYWLGIHPVTQAQWQAVMGNNPSRFKGANLPVERVSWEDCQKFVGELGQRTGRRFRLPTEAEWERACRAGTNTPFYFGQTISTDQVNYDGNYTYGRGKKGVYRKKTTPPGRFPPTAWGVCDMHGNVWEWCQDWYGGYPLDAVKDPQGGLTGEARVLRGGSWYIVPRGCRSAFRRGERPTRRLSTIGCRVVLCPD